MEDGDDRRTGATIIVVDDDDRVRELIRVALEGESYRVLEAPDSRTLFALLAEHRTDLVTLDIALAGESGLDLMKELRASHELGVIMITGRGELIDTVVGLELGADDYIAKPFELREVLARVRSVLRRYRRERHTAAAPAVESRGATLAFGRWRLLTAARQLHDTAGRRCELSVSEYDLLELLASNPRRALSRDEILERLRGRERHPSDRTIDNLVMQLRRKLSRPGEPSLIETARGVGYVFSADVTRR